jgi:SAM-dependent methyltransferase
LILSTLSPGPQVRILDLGCGDGRYTHILHRLGHRIVGLDLSLTLLRAGRAKYGNLPLVQGDMRAIPGRYDLILSLFTSFGYFDSREENLSVLASVNSALRPAGYFWLDFLNPVHVRRHLESETVSEISECCRVVEKRSIGRGRITKEIVFIDSDAEKHYTESVALYTREELENMIVDAGLEPRGCYGDYSGAGWHSESERTLVFAQRRT